MHGFFSHGILLDQAPVSLAAWAEAQTTRAPRKYGGKRTLNQNSKHSSLESSNIHSTKHKFFFFFFSKMLSTTIITSLILGLSQLTVGSALPQTPAPSPSSTGFIVNHVAADYFPDAKADLSAFDVDVRFVGYSATTESWLTALDPHSASSDEEKARMLTEAAYAKKYDENDADMTGDVESLLAHVAGNVTVANKGLEKRSSFQTSAAHAVLWTDWERAAQSLRAAGWIELLCELVDLYRAGWVFLDYLDGL
ncbi:hypothetical protein PDIG_25490 [Penicillium digitatum PHI26]|uniref:Uncharacterized protein n=2 Tax=Penicillium digitatum TaxID=36651 RepID=K9GL60_PEND2|nr:hypothetical protein PDIP_59970 [Penicillium digitatum Pd1]EKV10495.1 hypothetical protein PDIP_59970 [Penicillium digitatum Pd1]EKV15428.1 hypothetical protein PDIG_25490 [Penicillium digitatum PHI26]